MTCYHGVFNNCIKHMRCIDGIYATPPWGWANESGAFSSDRRSGPAPGFQRCMVRPWFPASDSYDVLVMLKSTKIWCQDSHFSEVSIAAPQNLLERPREKWMIQDLHNGTHNTISKLIPVHARTWNGQSYPLHPTILIVLNAQWVTIWFICWFQSN